MAAASLIPCRYAPNPRIYPGTGRQYNRRMLWESSEPTKMGPPLPTCPSELVVPWPMGRQPCGAPNQVSPLSALPGEEQSSRATVPRQERTGASQCGTAQPIGLSHTLNQQWAVCGILQAWIVPGSGAECDSVGFALKSLRMPNCRPLPDSPHDQPQPLASVHGIVLLEFSQVVAFRDIGWSAGRHCSRACSPHSHNPSS